MNDEPTESEEHEETKGTLVLMLLFLGVIAAMWLWMYFTLIGRT